MLSDKKTLVLGASPNSSRYSYMAVNKLSESNIPVIALGLRPGYIGNIPINTKPEKFENIHTVTLYIGSDNQEKFYDYIINLCPARIIFNPGTENPDFRKIAESHGIETLEACTLVMLATKSY